MFRKPEWFLKSRLNDYRSRHVDLADGIRNEQIGEYFEEWRACPDSEPPPCRASRACDAHREVGQKDSKFSQIVRVQKSHKSWKPNLVYQGYGEEKRGGFQITPKGMAYVMEDIAPSPWFQIVSNT